MGSDVELVGAEHIVGAGDELGVQADGGEGVETLAVEEDVFMREEFGGDGEGTVVSPVGLADPLKGVLVVAEKGVWNLAGGEKVGMDAAGDGGGDGEGSGRSYCARCILGEGPRAIEGEMEEEGRLRGRGSGAGEAGRAGDEGDGEEEETEERGQIVEGEGHIDRQFDSARACAGRREDEVFGKRDRLRLSSLASQRPIPTAGATRSARTRSTRFADFTDAKGPSPGSPRAVYQRSRHRQAASIGHVPDGSGHSHMEPCR